MTPIFGPDVFEFVSGSPMQTMRIGERLGRLIRPGDMVCLQGALGTGKTCFAQGVGKGWGVLDDLTSPTFTLVHELTRPQDGAVLYHVDLYRIESEREALLLGLGDVFDGRAACLVEWPERAHALLPEWCLHIDLVWLDDTRRRLTFSARGERHLTLLSELKRAAFGVNE